ncbi:hypothetical protein [Paenibacillus alkalitolerans]|uniref:hypothetical protein n=1 Tax=Paenibacillus alkalitolerans TaxID=2799335 RepID=UPI0018F76344|nr:hypothetical protein [Paenibacillus alkalitolerans]
MSDIDYEELCRKIQETIEWEKDYWWGEVAWTTPKRCNLEEISQFGRNVLKTKETP